MSTGQPASKRVTLNHFGPAVITRTATGFRVVAESGATADFRVIKGDIVVDAYTNCSINYMHAAIAAAYNRKNYVQPVGTEITIGPVRTHAEELAFAEGMSAQIDSENAGKLRRMGFRVG
jgi:hypothetical protein